MSDRSPNFNVSWAFPRSLQNSFEVVSAGSIDVDESFTRTFHDREGWGSPAPVQGLSDDGGYFKFA